MVRRTDDDRDGDHDGEALDPVDRRQLALVVRTIGALDELGRRAEVLVEAERERDDGRDRENDLGGQRRL